MCCHSPERQQKHFCLQFRLLQRYTRRRPLLPTLQALILPLIVCVVLSVALPWDCQPTVLKELPLQVSRRMKGTLG